jgi:hypothetical protein
MDCRRSIGENQALPSLEDCVGMEMRKRLGLGILLAAGAASAVWAQGVSRFDGQYVGALTLSGVVSGDCTTPPVGSAYPLSVSGGVVRFKYVPRFDTTLVGRVDAKGDFKATTSLHHGVATMTGHIDANHNLTALVQTPSCKYQYQTGP